jgi:quercetin dioxygenase-like cupin family protein
MKIGIAAFAFLIASAVLAQTSSAPVAISAEPYHKVALQNEFVNVYTVDLPPGKSTKLHQHDNDQFIVVTAPAQVEATVAGEAPVRTTYKGGETALKLRGFAHLVTNTGNTPFRNTLVELRREIDRNNDVLFRQGEDEKAKLITANKGVAPSQHVLVDTVSLCIWEVNLKPGESLEQEHRFQFLLVAVSDLNLRSVVEGKQPESWSLKAGEPKWSAGGFTTTLTNSAKIPARYMVLEFR